MRSSPADAAASIVGVSTENMVQAITDITVNPGIDPTRAVLIGGGGAAGLNTIFIARRLGIRTIVYPELGAALSAAGALMSDLSADHHAAAFTVTSAFDAPLANRTLSGLHAKGEAFLDANASGASDRAIGYSVEARYEHQVWEIEVPLRSGAFGSDADRDDFLEDFHRAHEAIFGFRDPVSAVEVIGWASRASCRLHGPGIGRMANGNETVPVGGKRTVRFPGQREAVDAPVHAFTDLSERDYAGPAIVETPFTTIVVDPSSTFRRTAAGSLVVEI